MDSKRTLEDLPASMLEPLEVVLHKAEELLAQGEYVEPQIFLCDTSARTAAAIDIDTSSEQAKDLSVLQAKAVAQDMSADLAIVIVEAWRLQATDIARYQEIIDQYGSLAEYPGRIDTLHVSVESDTHGVWMLHANIVEDSEDKTRRQLGPFEVLRPDEPGGRFVGLLSDKPSGSTH